MQKVCSIVLFVMFVSNNLTAFVQSSTASALPSKAEIERRVNSILSQMTIQEKVDLLAGVDGFFVRDVPRLNLPRLLYTLAALALGGTLSVSDGLGVFARSTLL